MQTSFRSPSQISVLYWTTTAALIAVPILVAAMLIMSLPLSAEVFSGRPVAEAATSFQLWAAMGLALMPMAAALWTLLNMRRLFAEYRRGRVLTHSAADLIRQIGSGLVVLALLIIVVGMAQSVILSWANPNGARQLAVHFGSAEIGFLLAGGLLTVIGRAMADAARVAEENRGFV